jgi:hypothetical protein
MCHYRFWREFWWKSHSHPQKFGLWHQKLIKNLFSHAFHTVLKRWRDGWNRSLSGDNSVWSYRPSPSPLTILRHCGTSTFTPLSIPDLDNCRQWCMNMYGHVQTSANIYEGPQASPKAREHLRRSVNISEVLQRSSNDFEDLRMSTKPFDYACGCIASVADIMDTFLGHIRHPRSPVKYLGVPSRRFRSFAKA